MNYTVKLNIEEITDFKSTKENQKLIQHILSNMSNFNFRETIKIQLNDMLEAEIEFENRSEIIKAFKMIIEEY